MVKAINFSKNTIIENHAVEMYHGTPENPENGRYYPTDSETLYDWYPLKNTILFLGHTLIHWYKPTESQVFCNPGLWQEEWKPNASMVIGQQKIIFE